MLCECGVSEWVIMGSGPRFHCVKKLDANGKCRATVSQRTTINRVFKFAAYQDDRIISRLTRTR